MRATKAQGSARELRRRVRSSESKAAMETSGLKGDALDAPRRTSSRGAFLLIVSVVTFTAFMLFVLTEVMHHAAPFLLSREVRHDVQAASLWVLMLSAPLTGAITWLSISVSNANGTPARAYASPVHGSFALVAAVLDRYKQNGVFAAYQTIASATYAIVLLQLLSCAAAESSASGLCQVGNRCILVVLAFIADELVVSSVLALEQRRDRNLQGLRDRFVIHLNNFNNMLLLVGAAVLAAASEFVRHSDIASTSSYPLSAGIGSLLLFVTALFNTYGLGGVLATKDGWRFFQPFMGGARFVVCQIISWSCFGAGLLLQGLYIVSFGMIEGELFVGAMLAAGVLFLAAEIATMVSLLVFRKSNDTQGSSPFEKQLKWLEDECFGVFVVAALANVFLLPNIFFFVYFAVLTNLKTIQVIEYGLVANVINSCLYIGPFISKQIHNQDIRRGRENVAAYHPKYVLPCVVAGIIPAYVTYRHYMDDREAFLAVLGLVVALYFYYITFRGDPAQTGRRMRPDWVNGRFFLVEKFREYFSGRIVTSEPPLDPKAQYIMAFHPHGITPLSLMWLQFSDVWRQLFPGVHAHVLTASVMHFLPVARDILQFFGSREITRQGFINVLQEKESVLVVPGGQAEMIEQRSGVKQVRIHTQHKGFIRMAIEHGVPLVPILSFQEGELLSNVRSPAVQKWFTKNLGVPFPHYPYGRWMLPIPRKMNAVVAVGAPLAVEKVENPSQEVVDKVHAEYFNRLEALFHEHKESAGCEDFELVLI